MSNFNQGAPTVPTLINSSATILTANAVSSNALTVRQFGTGNVFSAQTTTGSTALFVNAAGNVGVGTTVTGSVLDVYTADTTYGIRHTTGTIAIASYIASGSTTAPAQFGTTTNHKLGFYTNNGGPSVILDTNGRLGINQASPQTLFHVTATASNSAIFIDNSLGSIGPRPLATNAGSANCHIWADGVANGTADGGFLRIAAGGGAGAGNKSYIDLSGYSGTADMNQNIVFGTQGAERMRIRNDGNVGIGTTNPGYPLQVNSSATTTQVSGALGAFLQPVLPTGGGQINLQLGTAITTAQAGVMSFLNYGGNTSNILQFSLNGYFASSVNINSTGVGIGTTNPGYPLEVSGAAYMSGTVYVGTTNTDPTLGRVNGHNIRSDGRFFSRGAGHSCGIDSTSGTQIQFWTDNGSTRVAAGAITSSGSTTSYTGTSDYRLKDNIAPITGALNIISSLNPVTYTWKADGSHGHGFIAHELQEVVPDAVVGEKDAVDSDGNIKPQGIDKSYLVSYLTAAIQELSAKNTALEARLAALEARAPPS